jgi:hypothetical protein
MVGSWLVGDGPFAATVNVSEWSGGNVDVWVAFQCDATVGQPSPVVDLYGHMCSRLTGPNVKLLRDSQRVENEITVLLRGLD